MMNTMIGGDKMNARMGGIVVAVFRIMIMWEWQITVVDLLIGIARARSALAPAPLRLLPALARKN